MKGCNVNIPFYGKGAHLRGAVRSVHQQILDDARLELTIFDDHSPEPAADSLSRAETDKCQIIRSNTNVGMVPNWNNCLKHGCLPYVHVLHGDDMLAPDFYRQALSLLEDNKELGLIYTTARPLYSRKLSSHYIASSIKRKQIEKHSTEIAAAGDEAVRLVMKGVTCSAVVLRRKAVDQCGLFRTDLTYSADEEYWARVASRWSVARVSRPLAIYRFHAANYELRTWSEEDFWAKLQDTRKARLSHLKRIDEADTDAEQVRLARLALGIAHKLLGGGKRQEAQRYLRHAQDLWPLIASERDFERISTWARSGYRGQLIAWLLSDH